MWKPGDIRPLKINMTDTEFFSQAYLAQRYQEGSALFEAFVTRIGLFHEFYRRYCQIFLPNSTATALEVASGATIHSAIGIVPYISSIVLSAYEEDEQREAKLWRDRSPRAFNWRPFISAVLRQREGLSDGSAEIREDEIREKISDIVPCDLKKKGIIDPKYVPEGGFDVVTCISVLAVAASTMEEFYCMFENVHSLVKPGGLFMGSLAGRGTYYSVNLESTESPQKYPLLYVAKKDVEEALEKAGFKVKEVAVHPILDQGILNIADVKEVIYFVGSKM